MASTKELIESYYNAFNEKRFDDMLTCLSETVVHDINQGKRMYGLKEFKAFMHEMNTSYDENLTDIVIMVSQDERHASAEFVCHGIYKETAEGLPKASGQKYSLPVGCFFDIKDGKIERVTNYYNLNDWIAQVN